MVMFEVGDEIVLTKAWTDPLRNGDRATVLTLSLYSVGFNGGIRWVTGFYAGQEMHLQLDGYFDRVDRLGPW